MLDEKNYRLELLNDRLEKHEMMESCLKSNIEIYEQQLTEERKHLNELKQGGALIVDKTPSLPFNNDSNINESSSEISDEKETQGALK